MPTPGFVRYVALGDSYSSGEGVPPYLPGSDNKGTNTCHRSTKAYSTMVRLPGATSPILESQRSFLACSGAETENVIVGGSSPGQAPFEPSQLDRGQVDPQTTLITITIGGNDVGFEHVIEKCIGFGNQGFGNIPSGSLFDCTVDFEAMDFIGSSIRDVIPKLEATLDDIRMLARTARVVVLGYPRLFSGNECVKATIDLSPIDFPLDRTTSLSVSAKEQRFIRRAADELNAAIRRVAVERDVEFVNVADAFAGHELCACAGCNQEWIIGMVPAPALFDKIDRRASLHPNARGQIAYADRLNECLRADRASDCDRADSPRSQEMISAIAGTAAPGRGMSLGRLETTVIDAPCGAAWGVPTDRQIRLQGNGFGGDEEISIEMVVDGRRIFDLGKHSASPEGDLDSFITLPTDSLATGPVLFQARGIGRGDELRELLNLTFVVHSADADQDDDLLPDICDNCPLQANADQFDGDEDGLGDPCDPCLADFENLCEASFCPGDCDGNASVAISELVRGVNIALGRAQLTECQAFDTNNSGSVTVNELIQAVNAALGGCG